jgi:hypothetical protein
MFFGYAVQHSGSRTPAFRISIALPLVGALLAARQGFMTPAYS